MDRRMAGSPVYGRQYSGVSAPSSPGHPLSMEVATGVGFGHERRGSSRAAAANARLAKVMMNKSKEEYDVDSDGEDVDPIPAIVGGGGIGGRYRSRSPQVGSAASGRYGGGTLTAPRNPSPMLGRNVIETAPVIRSTSAGRSTLRVRTAPMMPQIKTTIRTPSSIPNIDPAEKQRDKRFFPDMRHVKTREAGEMCEASALQDKLDMLEEENYSLLEKLQLAEERWKEAEIRSRELEKQVVDDFFLDQFAAIGLILVILTLFLVTSFFFLSVCS